MHLETPSQAATPAKGSKLPCGTAATDFAYWGGLAPKSMTAVSPIATFMKGLDVQCQCGGLLICDHQKNALWDKLCADLDIEHRLTPPKSLQTNSMVERSTCG